jgi:hypothetical protein
LSDGLGANIMPLGLAHCATDDAQQVRRNREHFAPVKWNPGATGGVPTNDSGHLPRDLAKCAPKFRMSIEAAQATGNPDLVANLNFPATTIGSPEPKSHSDWRLTY